MASTDDFVLQGAICEIQVTTLAAHLFNELEHDITYKEHGHEASETELGFLKDVRRVTELADRQVAHLLAARREATRDLDIIDTPEALRFVLEHECHRPLSGDFARLFRMLDATVSRLSPAAIRSFSPPDVAMAAGKQLASTLGVDEADDVVNLVLGLEDLRDEFVRLAATWRGPKTALRRALEAVDTPIPTPQNGNKADEPANA